MVALNKPPRIASVPGSGISLGQSFLGKIQRFFEPRGIKPYLLHRLDAQTSGVMLFGKHEKDRAQLESVFKHPETRKKYAVLVRGVPHGNKITYKLESRGGNEKIPASTDYKVLKIFKAPAPLCGFVEAEIKTGRKHQIRKHFAIIGHPVVLDSQYGDKTFNRRFRIKYHLSRQFLHAVEISFFHPLLGKKITITAPLALDLQSTLKKLISAK